MALSGQLSRLGKQSAIYGLGGLVSRILAVLLLPLYTRYLSKEDYGEIETLIALVVVLTIILRFGISSAFFRFYFDADDADGRRLVLRTSFWFTMTMATLGLALVVGLAAPISDWLFGDPGSANLVRASAVALWAQMNYEQMTSLFRVEERPGAFVIASLTNVVLTIGGTVLLVEPFALSNRAENISGNPAAGLFYHASTFICTPSSLAQDVGRGMGAQSGESGMRTVFNEAGYTHFRAAHTSPFNIVYEARA